MSKTYMEFVQELRSGLLEATGYAENRIYFKEKEEFPPTSGDRMIMKYYENEKLSEVCALHVRDLYELYQSGRTVEELVGEIMRRMEGLYDNSFIQRVGDLGDYGKIRGELFIRLLNVDRNKADLENAVYRRLGDIALVLYARMGEVSGCMASMKIREPLLERWGKDRDEVFDEALVNTYFLSPPRIYQWEKMLFSESYEGDNFMNLLSDYPLRKGVMGNCLSTTKRTNGAAAVFLPGVAERIAALLEDSFYMVFTSIHEVMIHRASCVDPEDLRLVLADTVRETTPPEDFLTLNIFRYDRESGTFAMCALSDEQQGTYPEE